ncbi:gliding motility-associated C-terminal domain-containing protein [Rufibacter quisquiliarum]|uniref:Gliding motility-associated-like protein n=1 Tax=Rufibacter quisquiliarum TaxID=1549639 RepID=A0A839GJ12_9BACT|nr:gliding motility-associated C-terminal domain-containing protein [Rufibacter quisquiliarum]MBA9078610.1 gliding motility-associated-like protein [Rufibacter quisquiliarum]
MSPYKKILCFLSLLLFWSLTSYAQSCPDQPDPSIADANAENFIQCSSIVGSYDYKLEIYNTSTTIATNKEYTIEWGDGQKNTYPASFDVANHTYKTRGKFDLKVTVTSQSGCTESKTYTVFNGSNPGFGLQSPGNTSDCAPATFTFGITGITSNSPSTTYKIWFDDGSEPMYFTQATIPASITHTFTKSSRETANGFTIYGEAIDCVNRKTTSSVSGIIVSSKPIAGFSFKPGSPVCVNQKVDFQDESTGGFNGNNPSNSGAYRRNWSIEPATGWTYTNATSSTSEKPSIIFTQPGVYVIKLKVDPVGSSSTCQGDETSKTITVQEPGVAAFKLLPEQLNGCTPNKVAVSNLSSGTGVQYTWSVLPAEGVTYASGTDKDASPVFLFTKPGKYSVKLSAKNACGTTTATEEIIIRDKPTVTLPATATYCGPQTIAFTAANSAHAPVYDTKGGTISRYQWTLQGAGASFADANMATEANPTINFTDPGQFQVKVEIWNECGVSTAAVQTVTILEQPVLPKVAPALICYGTTATLTAEGNAARYNWYASQEATTVLGSNASFTTPALTATTTYYVEAVSANNCTAPQRVPVTVTVQPLPAAPTTAVAEIISCAGSSATLAASATGGTVTWFAAATGGEALGTGEKFTTPILTAGTVTYYAATVTPESCASSNRTPIKVTVYPAITGNTIGQAHTICLGGTATTLTGGTLSGGDNSFKYLWESSTDGVTFTSAANTRTSANYSPGKITQSTWFRRTVTSASGNCTSVSAPVKVTVVPAVTGNTLLTAAQTICSGTKPALIEGSLPGGGNGGTPQYLWESSTTSATASFTAATGTNNQQSFQPGNLTQTTWFRRRVTIDGCAQYTAAVQVSVNPLSQPPTAAGVTICSGATATLTATAPGGPYEWYASSIGGEPLFTGDSFETPALTATTTYYVQSTATGGCTVSRTAVKVTVQPPIANNTIAQVAAICQDATPATITGTKPTGGNGTPVYVWEVSTDEQTFTTAPGTFTGQNYSSGALRTTTWFRRKVTMGACVEYSNVVQVVVTPAIVPVTMPADITVCAGSPVPAIQVPAATGGDGTYTYRWEKSTTSATAGFTTITNNGTDDTYAPGVISNTSATVWYRRVTLSGQCTLTSGAIKVTVLPLPVAPTATNVTICQGSSTVLTATPASSDYRVQWYDAPTGGNLIHEGHALTTPKLEETTTYYAQTVSLSGCPSSVRKAVTVTVNPVIENNTIASGHTICAGTTSPQLVGSTPTGGNNGYQYAWEMSTTSATSGFGPITGIISNQINFNPGVLQQTTWYRRKVTSYPCSDYSEAVKVEVQPAIAQNTISDDQSICAQTAPALLKGQLPTGGDGNYTYVWESSTNSATSGFTTAAGEATAQDYAPAVLTQTTWFRRRVTAGACAGAYSNVVKVTVNQLPAAPQVAAVTVCHSERATLTVKSPLTDVVYEWYTEPTGGTAVARGTASFTTSNLFQSSLFYVQAVRGNCASPRISIAVAVLDPIGNNILAEGQQVCAGSAAATILGSVPTGSNGKFTYQWESSADGMTFTNASGSSTSPNYTPGTLFQSMWYRRIVKSENCVPHVSEPVKITVSPAINNNFITADQVIYGNSKPNTLSGTTPSGGNGTYSFEWQSSTTGSSTGFTAIEENGNSRTYSPGPLTQTTWFRRVVISGGCRHISGVVTITIRTAVSQNTITADQNICAGSTPATLTGSDPVGGDGDFSYAWEMSTTSPTSGFVTAPGIADDKNYAPAALQQTAWFRRKVSSGASTSTSNTVKVTVFAAVTNNTISTDQTICVGSSPARLTGSTPSGGNGTFTYVWESSTTSESTGFTTAAGTSSEQHYSPGTLQRTTWFRRRVLSGSCNNIISAAVMITANPRPAPPVAQGTTICAGTTTTLSASISTSGTVVEWYDAEQGGKKLFDGVTYTTLPLQNTTTFYVQSVSSGCASDRVPVTVTVPAPTAYAGEDVSVESGNNIELTASGGVSYKWFPSTGLTKDNIANPVFKGLESQVYTVTVTTAEGCVSTDEVKVTVIHPVNLTNGFTPNGDSMNETWELPDLKAYPNCRVEIFNRWGNKVFESKGYTTPWDGRYNGQPLPAATYYYIIRLDDKKPPLSGNVTIIK